MDMEIEPSLKGEVIGEIRDLAAGLDSEFLSRLISTYLSDARKRVDELEAFLAAADAGGWTEAAHALKGASASVGAARLAQLCAAAEKGGGPAAADARAMLDSIEEELERVRGALAAETSPLSAAGRAS